MWVGLAWTLAEMLNPLARVLFDRFDRPNMVPTVLETRRGHQANQASPPKENWIHAGHSMDWFSGSMVIMVAANISYLGKAVIYSITLYRVRSTAT